uniref:long-chain-fatty-acid--CoA ligase n=1 Tax=Henneguya salminicola TaxID=69463 RepID=A0A6G3MDV1_HENSL
MVKGVKNNLALKSRLTQLLFQTCYRMKSFYRKYGLTTPILDRTVFRTLHNLLGGRLELAFVGGAYISEENEEFANICFGNFHQGYGLTETCSAVLLTDLNCLATGSAGRPLSHCELKLFPWDEGNCDPNDPNDPRGEIAICGDCITLGYYKNKELTDSSYITDTSTGKRWFLTGDIAVKTSNGNFKIVDRKKDIIKLLHGEYVSLSKIESVVGKNLLIDIICIAPNKEMSYLVALIIPNRGKIMKFLMENNYTEPNADIEDLIKDSKITAKIRTEIENFAKKQLNRYEFPKYFHVLTDIWTPENNMITPTIKLKRTEISKRYSHLLN